MINQTMSIPAQDPLTSNGTNWGDYLTSLRPLSVGAPDTEPPGGMGHEGHGPNYEVSTRLI